MVCDSTRYLCQFACSKGKMGSFTSKSSDAFLKDEQDLLLSWILSDFRFTSLQRNWNNFDRSVVQNKPTFKASKLLLISAPSRRVCLSAVDVSAPLSFPYSSKNKNKSDSQAPNKSSSYFLYYTFLLHFHTLSNPIKTGGKNTLNPGQTIATG